MMRRPDHGLFFQIRTGGRRFLAAGRVILLVTVAFAALPQAEARASEPSGHPGRGKIVYDRCLACHAVDYDRVGPRHCGLKNRAAGRLPGYRYSAAFKALKIRWNEETLDRFLQSPLGFVPGTTMTYDGVKDPEVRANLIAYLLSLPPCG